MISWELGIRWVVCLIAAAVLVHVTLFTVHELRKGTDSDVAFFLYTRWGNLDDYRKTGKVYPSLTALLNGSRHGTFVGADGFNTDKMERHNYTEYYDIVLQPYFKQRVSLMEVGVRKGGSLKMWRELFSFNSRIKGIDISQYAPQFPQDNIKVLRASTTEAEDRRFLAQSLQGQEFDIVVDDGNHSGIAQYLTFTLLAPLLKPTGVYLMEDVARDSGEFQVYVPCGFDVSVHKDSSGERLSILYPQGSIASLPPPLPPSLPPLSSLPPSVIPPSLPPYLPPLPATLARTHPPSPNLLPTPCCLSPSLHSLLLPPSLPASRPSRNCSLIHELFVC